MAHLRTPLIISAILALALAGIFGMLTGQTAAFITFLLGWTVGTLALLRNPPRPQVGAYEELLRDLTASRREIVSAFEIERRRIERDLHDGAQQYLVASLMKIGEARLGTDADSVAGKLLAEAQDDAEEALKALRATVHGIHPQALSDLGLEASVRDLADRYPDATVRCPHPLPEIPAGVTACGYFFVSEALTNAAKHAPGTPVSILLTSDADLHITVLDNGPGGAEIVRGHGLSGMKERLAAFGGDLVISSPPGGPTELRARMPLLLQKGESGYETRHR
ncbi:MAG: histidine kinase [Flaviflexus sp.]|nr:histidine kinase [Flaviflexus sp.]